MSPTALNNFNNKKISDSGTELTVHVCASASLLEPASAESEKIVCLAFHFTSTFTTNTSFRSGRKGETPLRYLEQKKTKCYHHLTDRLARWPPTFNGDPSKTRYLLDILETKSYLLETYLINNYPVTYCHLIQISFLNI